VPTAIFVVFHRFGYSLSTDGIGVSVLLERPAKEDTPIASEDAVLDVEHHRYLGLDPGRRDLFVAVDGSEDHREQVTRLSNAEWRHLAGFTRAQKKRQTWLKNSGNIRDILRGKWFGLFLRSHLETVAEPILLI
jgi:hypothetical protein